MELGVVLDVPRRRVSLDAPETPVFLVRRSANYPELGTLLDQLDLSLGTDVLEVLIPKDEHLALGGV